ncbi:tail tape measure protein [Sphingomonas aquatilis]|uniref:Phage-related minor tail protein n=1 Tax=Sphingomonas aquatilis TaxID=93063 RepID=A0AAW3TQY6_9SPHN|nr:tail tape measure protein [Sphingomonas aquatilis]MBB3875362.1 phage-related minor tail protein [Sphingomonas aquatilis]MCI4654254.1 tail tape measure protein [Sphingomonas aquatilis]
MDEVERMAVGMRADTAGFAREVETMRATLEGELGAGAEQAGRSIERALLRAARTGQFGFDDLKATALGVLAEIARAAVRGGVQAAGGGSLGGVLAGLLGGLPGRATGGPVTPGRGYVVGERGPEVFVPTTSGRVEAAVPAAARDVRVTIHVQAGAGDAPAALQRSSRQVVRAVRAALEG